MNFEEAMHLAKKGTQIVRTRKNFLYTFGATRLPYICLSEVPGGVMVREGEVTAERPKITLPGRDFQMEGFNPGWDAVARESGEEPVLVCLARQVAMPPAAYTNTPGAERRELGTIREALDRAVNHLDKENDIRTGVLSAPEAVWSLSVLLYVGSQMARSGPENLREHFERIHFSQE
jgi:hypothetical protein